MCYSLKCNGVDWMCCVLRYDTICVIFMSHVSLHTHGVHFFFVDVFLPLLFHRNGFNSILTIFVSIYFEHLSDLVCTKYQNETCWSNHGICPNVLVSSLEHNGVESLKWTILIIDEFWFQLVFVSSSILVVVIIIIVDDNLPIWWSLIWFGPSEWNRSGILVNFLLLSVYACLSLRVCCALFMNLNSEWRAVSRILCQSIDILCRLLYSELTDHCY